MSFNITKIDDGFNVIFQFTKSIAKVSITRTDTKNVWYLESETDGYHWLNFWMAQNPESSELLNLSSVMEIKRCREAMKALGFYYEPEDKETCYLTVGENLIEDDIIKLSQFLESRFALREVYFPNDF